MIESVGRTACAICSAKSRPTSRSPLRRDRRPGRTSTGDGLWVRCENDRCRELLYVREFENNLKVCHKCEHHARLAARERIAQLVDEDSFEERDARPRRPATRSGSSPPARLPPTSSTRRPQKTGEREAAISGSGTIESRRSSWWCSTSASWAPAWAVWSARRSPARRSRGIAERPRAAHRQRLGGARMHEGIFSLMQMAKTVDRAGPARCRRAVPHFSVLTDPTLGGVTASFAGVGDVIIAERGRAGRLRRTARDRADHQAEAAARTPSAPSSCSSTA